MTTLTIDTDKEREQRRASRALRFGRRRVVWRVSRLKRLRHCGRYHNGSYDGEIALRSKDGVAYYDGVQTCASVWSCPRCMAKIRQGRADELAEGTTNWLGAGHGVEFVTLTVRHSFGQGLRPLFDAVLEGWRKAIVNGRPWQDDREDFGIAGYVRSIEVTYGENGWHPHVHALLFTEKPLTDLERLQLWARLESRWADRIERMGLGRPSAAHGCVVQPVRADAGDALARYLSKVQDEGGKLRNVGMEMTRHDLKEGRRKGVTPMQLLDAAEDGEAWAINAWHEWELVTKGRRCMTWSREIRSLLELAAHEPSDEELAADDPHGDLVMMLNASTWQTVVTTGADAALLDAYERGGYYETGLLLRQVRERARVRGPGLLVA